MANHPQLSRTPIKEIIFSISYSGKVDPRLIFNFSTAKEIADKYELRKDSQLINSNEGGELGEVSNDNSHIEHTFSCKAENKIINIREGSLSFHKVNEYENFESLVNDLMNLWGILVLSNKSNLNINNTSARYLNFIETENNCVKDILKVFPANPFTNSPNQSFIHLSFKDSAHSDVKIDIVAAYPVERDEKKNIVLDILLNKHQNNISDYGLIKNDFETMREIKNNIFFSSITNDTLEKYL